MVVLKLLFLLLHMEDFISVEFEISWFYIRTCSALSPHFNSPNRDIRGFLLKGSSKNFWFRLYPEEVLCIIFFCILLFLANKYGTTLQKPTVTVKALINAFIMVFGLALIARKSGLTILKIIHNWAPVILVLFAYENLGNLVRFINPHDVDPILKKADEFIFGGVNPTLWLERFTNPVLSEIFHSFYTSYYPFLPILGFVLYAGRDYEKFRNVMLSVTLGFYLGYIGYMLMPTVGPRFYMADMFTKTVQGTTMVSERVAHMLNALESTRRDCFPSLHTAITVIVTAYAFRYRRSLFWFLFPVNIGIIIATVYLRYHYVVDVIAGLFLAAFCLWAGPRLNEFWYKNISGRNVAEDYPADFGIFYELKIFCFKIKKLLDVKLKR
jgi:membrane-associated phospholipid phosphatase